MRKPWSHKVEERRDLLQQGGPLTAVDAREHSRRGEILEVADLVIGADPAVAAALDAQSASDDDA